MLNDKQKNYLHLHLIVFIWGFTAILGALISLDSLPLVWYRMLLAVLFIGIYLLFTKKFEILSLATSLKLLLAGFIIAVHWFTFFKAIKMTNVSITLACISTGAFFTSIIEPIFFGKKWKKFDLLLGIIVVFGLLLITYGITNEKAINQNEIGLNQNTIFGILIALFSAFLSALFAVINSNFVKQYDSKTISFYELLGGVLFFTIILGFTQGFPLSFFLISNSDWKYLFILSSICTAYAFIVSTGVMRYLSPYTVMLTINLEPIYGIILAIIIFDDKEKMNFNFYIGALIIITSVILNGFYKVKSNLN